MTLLLLCIALSADSFSVGASFGLRGVKIPWLSKAVIFCVTMALTFCAVFAGDALKRVIPDAAAAFTGAFLLFAVGGFTIYRSFKEPVKHDPPVPKNYQLNIKPLGLTIEVIRTPEACDFDRSNSISMFEAVFLSIALSVDSVVAGVGGGMAGFTPFAIPPLSALLSVLFLSVGHGVGKRFSSTEEILLLKLLPGGLLILTGLLRLLPSG